eukprot:919412-Pelagomonas_calceolata.AAC.1
MHMNSNSKVMRVFALYRASTIPAPQRAQAAYARGPMKQALCVTRVPMGQAAADDPTKSAID